MVAKNDKRIEDLEAEARGLLAEVRVYHDRAMLSEAAEAGLRGDLACHLLENLVLQAEVAELTAKVARVKAVLADMLRAGDMECAELVADALAGQRRAVRDAGAPGE